MSSTTYRCLCGRVDFLTENELDTHIEQMRDANDFKRHGRSLLIPVKMSQSMTEAGKEEKNAIRRSFSIIEQNNSKGIESIVLGLFALIGFIILIYSIFIAAIGEPLASVADTIFIAALIGSFTLVATIINHMYIKR